MFEIAEQRDKGQKPSCAMREPVWHWLVKNLGPAYAPKGRHDAEIFSGLQEMSKSSLFRIEIVGNEINIY